MSEITVNNPTRTRKWGWDFSTTPTGEDAYSIRKPTRPYYTGTYKQVCQAINEDPTFNNLGGTFYNTCWFYDGREILGFTEGENQYPFSIWDPEFDKGPITLILRD